MTVQEYLQEHANAINALVDDVNKLVKLSLSLSERLGEAEARIRRLQSAR